VTGKAAFLGLGAMGYPMAGHLARIAETSVWNRTAAKSEAWAKEHKGRAAENLADAVRDADAVFACLGADKDVEEVFLACLPHLKPGALFVDHTTASAELARRLAGAAADKGVGFLDAPVSGGQAGAQNGALTIMVGGEAAALERAQPYLAAYGKSVTLIGPAGAGQLAKMVNQICIAGLVQGLAEGLHFAEQAGLDPETVIAAIGKGAAQSWQMDNRWRTMTEGKFAFGFAVDWMRKDLGLVLDEARRNGAQLPVAALVDQFYAEVQAMGGSRWDTSSLIARLKKG
jgi:3-hydroxyisobutyrate dehydrogenase-like beta-hydroxyacid dehydrogenase